MGWPETQPNCEYAATGLLVLVKMEVSLYTPLSQPSDQNAVDINTVYTISLYSCSEYKFYI